jgi:hypothetical protein
VRADLRRYTPICLGSSGSDHIHADRIALLLAPTAHLTISHFGSLRVPGIAEVTSPAGIARRPDGTTPFEHRSIQHRPFAKRGSKKRTREPGANAKEFVAN